jgi:hypothetical protein
MNPAFFTPRLRTFIPLFQSSADKVKARVLYNVHQLEADFPIPISIACSKMEGRVNRRRLIWPTTCGRDGMAFTDYARHYRRG